MGSSAFMLYYRQLCLYHCDTAADLCGSCGRNLPRAEVELRSGATFQVFVTTIAKQCSLNCSASTSHSAKLLIQFQTIYIYRECLVAGSRMTRASMTDPNCPKQPVNPSAGEQLVDRLVGWWVVTSLLLAGWGNCLSVTLLQSQSGSVKQRASSDVDATNTLFSHFLILINNKFSGKQN